MFGASATNPASSSTAAAPAPAADQQKPRATRKRKGHRGGKKKRSRRKSFAALTEDSHDEMHRSPADAFYQMPASSLSGASIDSEALLDHREQRSMRIRRSSSAAAAVAASSSVHNPYATPAATRLRAMHSDDEEPEESAPLLPDTGRRRASPTDPLGYGSTDPRPGRVRSRRGSSRSSRSRTRLAATSAIKDSYHVNHPPSVPGSPIFGAADHPEMVFGDVMIRDELSLRSGSPRFSLNDDDDADLSTVDGPVRDHRPDHGHGRRHTVTATGDVCFPVRGMSEIGEEEETHSRDQHHYRSRRRRGQWPDLETLEEWKRFEKEENSEGRRVKKITEPQLINGRLRPVRKGWYQSDDEAPYRFTYFNEEFQSTIHSPTISELVQPGGDFRELFIPEPRVLSDDESDDDAEVPSPQSKPCGATSNTINLNSARSGDGGPRTPTRLPSYSDTRRGDGFASPARDTASNIPASGRATPRSIPRETKTQSRDRDSASTTKPIRYGDRPVWWLDVLCPTEAEMKVIAKAFGIHPLTAEDIMVQEAREKVELFRNYYFVNYRTFDQDLNSGNDLEPVNMYVVVFRESVLSFHFSMTPHSANVRRRIRQLRDYLILSSDWISYAIIDDITDVFQPLIQNIEAEVDEIDGEILQLHSSADKRIKDQKSSSKNDDNATAIVDSSDMLRRVGDCRKRVMSLYRLLGNKADVIKGFAKRCNERWEVAPRSEIGLYLGDIQDHIVTMTSNLGHYEKILARTHANYLAQINIRMNERQEQTADVLGRLTVLGTIVLPMNIITGLWGMNVWVPGQQYEGDLAWFVWITVGLICFGLACYLIAKRVYKIV
ncbi:CorA family metal ion transporter [Ophiocordyceps camponoti-floridani]|uniref:CorA family metal ion transporter n=1 Tax=Ophiocordyceps camponoti-floridani TaxID=2030778 RepID=A0A8H4Q6V5_9HYPO|nr:CorA family metal ion transporter [Ophiocordyceps camponoti-floridani]